MASTYTQLHYHLVFSTRNRNPWIEENWENHLHAFLNGCLQQSGCHPNEIGGHIDHLHVLTGIKPTHRVFDVVCDIKSASLRSIHETVGLGAFKWQEGYGAFTTSVREESELRRYIRNQKEHHRRKTFLEVMNTPRP